MKSEVRSLDHLVLFVLEISLFSGARKVKPEDIKVARGVEITPDSVLTLGTQRVFDPEHINQLSRLKTAMHRECLSVGTRFLGPSSYAVPEGKAVVLAGNLDGYVAKFKAAKDDLVRNYGAILDGYCRQRPAWASRIRANAFTPEYVADQIQFGYVSMRVTAPENSDGLSCGLKRKAGGLLRSLLADVALIAEKLEDVSLSGRDSVTRKALRPLRAAREKLLGFAFLDPRIVAIARMISSVEEALPSDGPITGKSLAMLTGVAAVLSDPEKALAVAEQESSASPPIELELGDLHFPPVQGSTEAEEAEEAHRGEVAVREVDEVDVATPPCVSGMASLFAEVGI